MGRIACRQGVGRLVAGALAALAVAVCVSLSSGVGVAGASFGFRSGAEGFSVALANRDGSADAQAGSHPYSFTTSFVLNTTTGPGGGLRPDQAIKDLRVELPAGLVGNPGVTTKCTALQLYYLQALDVARACPASSQVGIIELRFTSFEVSVFVPVYNITTPVDKPAVFGFSFAGVGVFIDTGVRTGGDYGLTSSLTNISGALPLEGSKLILWGVPGDPGHDVQRCISPNPITGFCEAAPGTGAEAEAPHSANLPLRPLFSLPTSCSGPLTVNASADSWQEPGVFVSRGLQLAGMEGCERVPFSPSVNVTPDSGTAGAPTGLGVDIRFPQEEAPEGLAEANLKKAVVKLPAGMAISPSAADGLGACSEEQIGLHAPGGASCPDSSKVGSVEIVTPALEKPLVGSVYLAQQGNAGLAQGSNPFGSLLALYLVAEGSGVRIKVAGEVKADPVTGQLTTVFDNNPQQPIGDLKLTFFGGPRAALVNPPSCGSYTAEAALTPWSSETAVETTSSFQINQGCHGSQFAPSFVAGTTNNQAGGFSPLSVTFSRSDQDEALGGVKVVTPPGLLGLLKTVPLCGESQAAAGTCGEESLIGHTTVGAGPGGNPVYIGGKVFLTGPYKGAPFGLSIVVPAVAGPFNLGTVVVRATINVDPHTAALTVVSDPLPTILQGIPLQVRTVNVTVDRPGFIFNPTDCEPLSVGGVITSTQGVQAAVSSRFQAANCAALPFAPRFSASAPAATSRNNGAALDVKVGYPQGAQANIHSVKVTLPKQLPARLSTVQQACPAATFEANPASCGEGALIGTGTASTPIFAAPLTGPAYLVSHGGESFPDVVVVLQGQGVTVDLVGNVFIAKSGATSATFANVPDAPITAFDLSLPEGPHSGLSAVGSLCAEPLTMPTTITGQNGAQLTQTTKIAVSGCPKAKKKSKPKKKHKKKHRKAKKGSAGRGK
jgi:hypothetical protein